jgi:hypothetical protein
MWQSKLSVKHDCAKEWQGVKFAIVVNAVLKPKVPEIDLGHLTIKEFYHGYDRKTTKRQLHPRL